MTTLSSAYAKRWHYERSQGRFRTTPVEAARSHVQALMDAGWSQRAVADAAGVGVTTVNHVVLGHVERVKHATSIALLAVTEDALLTRSNPLGFVRRIGARRRVQALLAIGHRHADITAAMQRAGNGCRVPSELVLSQRGAWIARMTHDAIVAAYDELSMTPGHSARTRSRAMKSGFQPPLAWDDETIDDPLVEPMSGEPDEQMDEVAVERIMAGSLHVPSHSQSPERREAIRRLAARGYTDRQIGERLGLSTAGVGYTRSRHNIPSGVACSRAAAS